MKKGGNFEHVAIDFLERIFTELEYEVVRKRIQESGTQDGYDNLIEIVDRKYKSYTIYSECKDYSTHLNYTQAIEKIPHIISTHEEIDLLLFISPYKDFSNTNEDSKLNGFYEVINDRCPTAFLTPESFVKEYFSLYPEIYKKIHKQEIIELETEKRKELLSKFEKMIFSSKKLKKIVINEEDKKKYIGDICKDEYHIPRTFRKFQDRGIYIFDNPKYQINLEEQLNKSKFGVVVLGNPGFGKSFELKNFAIELWENKEDNLMIPKFVSLKNFNSDTTIESLLPPNYKYISDLVIIFDGLDEVQNITDFTNKIRSFISENSTLIRNNKLKFIISCRTSIYNKYVKNLEVFDICFLNEISENLAFHFLLKKYNLDLSKDNRFSFWKYRDILQNPFYLVLLGEHYKASNEILLNKYKLIEKYVQNRLDEDEKIKFRNDPTYNKTEILETSKKIALTMEAMQKSIISSSEISGICGKIADVFKNPFLEQNLDETWSFEHKNIQEYFVAKILSKLSFQEILDFIKIENSINKIHPSWINVVSFLLNSDLPKSVYDNLIDWISKNDLQFIFEADADRINKEIRIKGLQEIFEKTCIKDTLWIDNTSEIALFGNVEENVNYLLEKVQDKSIHKRARISAINLLSYMSYNSLQTEEIKKIIFQIVDEFEKENKDNLYLLQDVFQLVQNSNLKCDLAFYQNLLDRLKPYDYTEIVSSILYTIPNELIEFNVDCFLEILQKSIGEKQWVNRAETRSAISRKETLFDIFKKIENQKTLLKIYSFLVERHKNYEIRESLIKDFLKHLKSVFSLHPELNQDLIKIISNAVILDKIRYYEDDLLVELIKSCRIEKEVFFSVFDKFSGNFPQKSFLAEIVKEEFFPEIIDKYNSGDINDDFIKGFRNIISYRDIDLSIAFENEVEKKAKFSFKKDKIDKQKVAEITEFHRTKRQREFDILFDKKELKKQMLRIFKFKNKKELTFSDIDKFYHDYYKNDELRLNVTENAKQILWEILKDNFRHLGALKSNQLWRYIQKKELNIMIDILNSLPKENEQNISVTDSQKEFIRDWCIQNTETIKNAYKNYMFDSESWLEKDYYTLETMFKFQQYFKFDLDEELLLDMIWLNRFTEGMNLDYMEGIVDKSKIAERIIHNINTTKDKKSLYSYITYFVENNMDLSLINFDIKEKIKEFLLNDNEYYARRLIELLYVKDVGFLKELLDVKYHQPKRHMLDFILNIFIKENHFSLAEKYLKDNYDLLIKSEILDETNIIKILINANSDLGFKKLLEIIENNPDKKNEIDNHFSYATWQNYSNENSIDDLLKILEISLVNEDKASRSHFSAIRISTETIISICKNKNPEFCIEVLEKLNKIDFAKITNSGGDLFHFNRLKRDVNDIVLNLKSRPFTFRDSINLVERSKYIFYL